MQEPLYPAQSVADAADAFVRTLPVGGRPSSIHGLLADAERRGHLVIALPGVSTMILSPGGHADHELVAELGRRSGEIEQVTRRGMPTNAEAAAWSRLKRDHRARIEP